MPRNENAPAYQVYVEQQLADSAVLTLEQIGAYTLLSYHSWREVGLPQDHAELARLARLSAKKFEAMAPILLRFFEVRDSRLVLGWQEKEREKQKQWREKSRIGGLNSARSRDSSVKGGSTTVAPKANTVVGSLQSAKETPPPNPPRNENNGGLDSKKLEAEGQRVFASLRNSRVQNRSPQGGVNYRIERAVIDALSERGKSALEVIGGAQAIANADDIGLRVLRGQFTTAYTHAEIAAA